MFVLFEPDLLVYFLCSLLRKLSELLSLLLLTLLWMLSMDH